MVADAIAQEQYYLFPNTTTTVCCLRLHNGFSVTGESACVSLVNFDERLGQQIAYDKAKDKIWELLAFRLCESLHQQAANAKAA